MIDMHAHWRPAELIDALRARTQGAAHRAQPGRRRSGEDAAIGEEPVAKAFDDVDFHLAKMARQDVSTSVLSLLGALCWIESQPLGGFDAAVPDGQRRPVGICQKHPGPLSSCLPRCRSSTCPPPPPSSSARWRCRAWSARKCRETVFSPSKDAEAMRPLLEVANRHHAIVFIHHGPRPGDAFPKVPATPTTRAGATARSTCRRACPR